VRGCSHVGGHAYAGNLLIFAPTKEAPCEGDWYGYVRPSDVPALLDARIRDGESLAEPIKKLWRGVMGMQPEACISCAQQCGVA
jgi:(2Fe-2S) ferredoxin